MSQNIYYNTFVLLYHLFTDRYYGEDIMQNKFSSIKLCILKIKQKEQ